MNEEQLLGRIARLREELALAYSSLPWNDGHVERLHHDLASALRLLESLGARAGRDEELPAASAAKTADPSSSTEPQSH